MLLGMACNKDRVADTEETKEEEPGLRISRPAEDITDQWQSYEDGEWSVVRVQYFDTLD